jgi:hypothetical protein
LDVAVVVNVLLRKGNTLPSTLDRDPAGVVNDTRLRMLSMTLFVA